MFNELRLAITATVLYTNDQNCPQTYGSVLRNSSRRVWADAMGVSRRHYDEQSEAGALADWLCGIWEFEHS
jgi:hypothetical protein